MVEPPRTRQTQEQRVAESSRRLLEAAIELISEKGFERTTAAEISERAGYSRPMIRTRYGSKEGLLEALLSAEYNTRLFRPVSDDQACRGIERVLGRLDLVRELGEREPRVMRAFLILSFETAGPVVELRPWMTSLLSQYRQDLEESLRAGIDDGSINTAIDPVTEAEHILADGIGRAFLSTIEPETDGFVRRMRSWRAEVEQRLS